jgi:hypothetical protein
MTPRKIDYSSALVILLFFSCSLQTRSAWEREGSRLPSSWGSRRGNREHNPGRRAMNVARLDPPVFLQNLFTCHPEQVVDL